jgi:xylulokinase
LSYLGLDIGTGGCKAVAFTKDGKELASSSREYPLLRPHPDWAELNPDEVISNCFKVISEVNAKISDPVVSMSISSQGEAFAPIGNNGQTLGNAMVSSDSRARDLASEWSNSFGIEKIYHLTGHTPHPLFSLFKILWIKDNQPEVWKNTRYFLCFEDLFHYRLGLEPKISWPLAGRTMMFDVMGHTWSNEILLAAGLSIDKLAVPVASGELTGTIDLITGRKMGFKNPVRHALLWAQGFLKQECVCMQPVLWNASAQYSMYQASLLNFNAITFVVMISQSKESIQLLPIA